MTHKRNVESDSYRESIKNINTNIKETNRKKKLLGAKLQKIAGIDDFALHKAIKKYGRPITYKQQRSISWLSPEGVLYDADDYTEHSAWLEDMLKKSGDKNLYESYKRKNTGDLDEGDDFAEESDIVKFMEANNYVRVNSVGNELDISTADETTPAQNKVLQDIAINKRLKPENIVLDGYSYDDVSTPGMTQDDYEVQRFRRMGLNKIGKLNNRLQKIAVRYEGVSRSYGSDLDALDAFMNRQSYQGFSGKGKNKKLKFESTGDQLKLHGHVIASHTPKGLSITNAKHDTPLTYSVFRDLGIKVDRLPEGKVQLHDKVIDALGGENVLVPYSTITGEAYVKNPNAPKSKQNRTVTEQNQFRVNVTKNQARSQGRTQLPFSEYDVLPGEQETINRLTGVKSKIPEGQIANEAHHLLPVKFFPGLKTNPANGIMLTRQQHKEVHDLNKGLFSRTSKLKQRLAERYRAFTNTSSFVGNMRYDQDEQEMTGILSGKHYKWCGVPERTFDAFQGAGSAGAFFNRNVKGQFDCSSGGILTEGQSRISKLKQRVALIEPMIKKKKKGRVIKKVSPRVAMQDEISKETIRRAKNNKEIPELGLGEGRTYIADIDKYLDAFNPEDADFLNKRYPGKGDYLAIISTTTNIDDIDALEPYHARLREKGIEALTGFYRNTQTGKLEFDSSYAKRFNSLDEIDPELQVPTEKSPTGQESALVITPDNKAELYFNKKYDPKQVLP